jgi:transposase
MSHNRRVGRATLLTPELRAQLERELADGHPIAVAAQRHGLGRRTLTRWISEGLVVRRRLAPAPDPEPVPTEELLDAKLAKAEVGLVGVIAAAAQRGSWQSAAWILERRWPERWARPPQRTAPENVPPAPAAGDPFAEIDMLAERRRRATLDPTSR